MNFRVRRKKIFDFRGLQTENIEFWRSGRRPGELREGPRGRFPSVLVVFSRFWKVLEVLRGFGMVLGGFQKDLMGF